VAHRNWLVPRD